MLPSASGHGKRLMAAVWGVYVLGAMAAGAATQRAPDLALMVPAADGGRRRRHGVARFWRAEARGW